MQPPKHIRNAKKAKLEATVSNNRQLIAQGVMARPIVHTLANGKKFTQGYRVGGRYA